MGLSRVQVGVVQVAAPVDVLRNLDRRLPYQREKVVAGAMDFVVTDVPAPRDDLRLGALTVRLNRRRVSDAR